MVRPTEQLMVVYEVCSGLTSHSTHNDGAISDNPMQTNAAGAQISPMAQHPTRPPTNLHRSSLTALTL